MSVYPPLYQIKFIPPSYFAKSVRMRDLRLFHWQALEDASGPVQ